MDCRVTGGGVLPLEDELPPQPTKAVTLNSNATRNSFFIARISPHGSPCSPNRKKGAKSISIIFASNKCGVGLPQWCSFGFICREAALRECETSWVPGHHISDRNNHETFVSGGM